jgi:hypothetical protein
VLSSRARESNSHYKESVSEESDEEEDSKDPEITFESDSNGDE